MRTDTPIALALRLTFQHLRYLLQSVTVTRAFHVMHLLRVLKEKTFSYAGNQRS